jgi:hypothetical protein
LTLGPVFRPRAWPLHAATRQNEDGEVVKQGCLQPAKGGSGRGELKAPKKTKDIELSYCIEIYNVEVWNMVKLTLHLNMQACQQHSDLKPPGSNPILSALDKSLSQVAA